MNILYVIDNDLSQNWAGYAHRTRILYESLCAMGDVYVLQLATIPKDEFVSERYLKIPMPPLGIAGLNKHVFKVVRELCRFRPPIMFYPKPFRNDLAELFSGIKFDVVVTRYINYVGALHLWNIAPLYVDLDDYPMQTIESIFCPKVSPWRRPFFKIIERIFVSKSLKHTTGVWLSNPNQLRLLDKSIKAAPLENLVMVDYARSNPNASREDYIFTCGIMSYYANIVGITKFLQETWPVIHEALPTLKYYIVGKDLADETKEVWSKCPNVEILGYVENIADIYNKAVAAVVPIYDGSGTCIKTLECLAYSRICISTKFGARGIIDKGVGADSGICLYETPQECLSWIQKAINDSAWRTKSETAAKLFFSANYSQEKFNAQVKDMIFNNL